MTWRRILVATDFSATARVALRSAESLAAQTGAGLVLAHVVDVPATSYPFPRGDAETREAWIESARRKLDAAAARSRERGVRVLGTELRVGKPWFELVELAREAGVDLVCLGNSGHSRFGRLLLGSTAENMIRHSPVPVLVTRSRALGRVRRVLVPVDFDAGARASIEFAMGKLPRGTAVEALHVVPPVGVIEPGFPVEPPSEAEVVAELLSMLNSLGAKRVKPRAVVNADPGRAILQRARAWRADLILICTHGRGGLARVLLGSVAERVARYADRPVLILPPPARKATRR